MSIILPAPSRRFDGGENMIAGTYPLLLERQLRTNAYFSSRHRLLYVATPKVACTGLKWWFAELVDVREAMVQATVSLESDPELVIHDTFVRVAPEYTGANETGLVEALASPDYFRFCLVRNPYTRVFSAWQSKWLIREALQVGGYESADFFQYSIEKTDDIRVAFESFLEYLRANEWPDIRDAHVTPQADLLEPQLMSYRVIAHVEEPTELLCQLSQHLGEAYCNPFATKSTNVSLLPYCGGFYSDRAVELVKEMYARDFELFGYSLDVPSGSLLPDDDAMGLAARAIKLLRGRNERIGVLGRGTKPNVDICDVTSLEVQLFYVEDRGKNTQGHFIESCSVRANYPNEGKRISFDLKLPGNVGQISRLRLDVANAPVAVYLHAMSLITPDGETVWEWAGDCRVFIKRIGVVCVTGTDGVVLLCLNNDPQFELAIPEQIQTLIHGGAVLLCELTPKPLLEQLLGILDSTGTEQNSGLPALTNVNIPVGFSCYLEELAVLLKVQTERKNTIITTQHDEIKLLKSREQMLYEQVVRAEAQLDLLKELCLSEFGQRQERL